MSMSTTGSYRIQSVARMTGVSAATLRAWERRYGFPAPSRSDAAYRLFTSRDIELVKAMRQLIESGLAPNEAARKLQQAGAQSPVPDGDPYAELSTRLLDSIARLDAEALLLDLRRALVLDSAPVVFQKIIGPLMERVGSRWACGELSVAHEHFASHVIGTTVLGLLRLTEVRADAPKLLLACFAEEAHELPLYGVALSARGWGYKTIVLGGRTPPSAVAQAVVATSPACVGLSVTVAPEPGPAARELVEAYADACAGTPFVVGGRAAPLLRPWVEALGGVVSPSDPEGARLALLMASGASHKFRR